MELKIHPYASFWQAVQSKRSSQKRRYHMNATTGGILLRRERTKASAPL